MPGISGHLKKIKLCSRFRQLLQPSPAECNLCKHAFVAVVRLPVHGPIEDSVTNDAVSDCGRG